MAAVDIFMTYQFIKKLTTPFNKWPAYKAGVIDKDGNILIKRKDMNTTTQKNSFKLFDLLVLNLKKLLAKFPGGRSKIATYAAALFLIKEAKNYDEDSMANLEEDFADFFAQNAAMIAENMEEDAPVNNVGDGNIAGTRADGLKITPKRRKKYKDQNAIDQKNIAMNIRRITNA